MEGENTKRKALRQSFTVCANNVEEVLRNDETTVNQLCLLQKQLLDKFSRLEAVQENIAQALLDDEDLATNYDEDFAKAETYRDRFCAVSTQLELKINMNIDASKSANAMEEKRKFKLPRLELKRFTGEPKDFLAFWSQFSKIHSDDNIPDEDKFQYLLQSVVPKSKAARLVESYPPTRENYSKVIVQLKDRFGRDELLVQIYVRDLLSLVMKNASGKGKVDLSELYDLLESKLLALESLGRTKEKFADFLEPLVESCLPEQVLRAWERSRSIDEASSGTADASVRSLERLMSFLRSEVQSEEMIILARSGLGVPQKNLPNRRDEEPSLPTNAVLINAGKEEGPAKFKCIFCSKQNHFSSDCFLAQKMSLKDKKSILIKNKACFKCFKLNHSARFCRNKFIKCGFCDDKSHQSLMCPKKEDIKVEDIKVESDPSITVIGNTLSNQSEVSNIYLQTIMIKISHKNKELVLRCLLDSGSENSYITQRAIEKLNLTPVAKQIMLHGLFGGKQTGPKQHSLYNVEISSLKGDFSCKIPVLSENKICGCLPKVRNILVLSELKEKYIDVPDIYSSHYEIDLLMGADSIGLILTGMSITLECGLTAVETKLGYTLMGKIKENFREHVVMSVPAISERQLSKPVVSMLSTQLSTFNIKELWDLETIGIRDPVENLKGNMRYAKAIEQFENNLNVLPDGRYELSLPFKTESKLPSNKSLTLKRHKRMCQGIIDKDCLESYVAVFKEWERLKIIEKVPDNEIKNDGYYMPHRPVYTPSKTTKIRPVFDASARERSKPSLNDCLHRGPNLIELIPDILDRFRVYPIGISGDIEKAFLQLSITPKHKDFLRFFYPHESEEIIYRHCRVVFGVCSSPFLLAASIKHLLEHSPPQYRDLVNKLRHSFYVDNCVTGVFHAQEIHPFISKSEEIMKMGCFNLRAWESNVKGEGVTKSEGDTNVLGVVWNLDRDTLRCFIDKEQLGKTEQLTKRSMLSAIQRIFDPIGILTAATLQPKVWLQETWKLKLSWDDPLPPDLYNKFNKWFTDISLLEGLEIPRYCEANSSSDMHVFVDASKTAFAACVFLRSKTPFGIKLHLIRAKARVAPSKTVSIPRLELLACCVGARLAKSIQKALDLPDLTTTFWTDSMVALYWIKHYGEWSIFVANRVREIGEITPSENWRHVPGHLNPADVLSRGCSPRYLLDSKWCEGPAWLIEDSKNWPTTEINCAVKEVDSERRKVKLCHINVNNEEWYSNKFSNYHSIIRLTAWIKRFLDNCRKTPENRATGKLSCTEIERAEKVLIRSEQSKFFPDPNCVPIINVFKDDEGLLRVKTRITERKDDHCFLSPILLPENCTLTVRLIQYLHHTNCHAGTQILLSIIREKYWILKARKTVRNIVRKCVRCRRYSAKPAVTEPVALPPDRVRDTNVFEVLGVDLAGPLFLQNGEKVWIVLYTCAVFRAVHLELITSLSTENFLLSFRRFIARRGRPKIVYSDNGTNFRGAVAEFKNLDWESIERETEIQQIKWKFIPPTAAWWGGWWERLIRVVKDLLKRTLGNAILSYEELLTVLCDCESIINSRPLTYISEDSEDLVAITPAMFLMSNSSLDVTDLDLSDFAKFQKRVKFRSKLLKDLRSRFRKEYLGLLVEKSQKPSSRFFTVGEVVLIENPNKKRLYWPLAKVLELIPGRDGKIRSLRLKCGNSIIIRPIQRVFPLEVQSEDIPVAVTTPSDVPDVTDDPVQGPVNAESIPDASADDIHGISRYGRKVKPPKRLDLLNVTLFFE